MATATTTRKRKVWIDWMKAIGIFTIVWGHCFPEGMNSFVYAFNVPVFFAISGYLTHRESTMRTWWDKCLHNLLIPYLILAFLKCAGPIVKHLGDGQFVWSLIGIFGGFHSINGITGCNNLWFVYTLILIKLLYQLCGTSRQGRWTLAVLAVVASIAYNHMHLEWTWAVTNMFLALPFFMLGNVLSGQCHEAFDNMTSRIRTSHNSPTVVTIFVMAATVWILSFYNDAAYMFEGRYGNNIILFAAGAVIGSMMLLLISLLLDAKDWRIIKVISSGTIVILVFHRELLHPILKIINKQDLGIVTENILIFAIAWIVVLTFVPIILLLKRFFPVVLGRRAKNI